MNWKCVLENSKVISFLLCESWMNYIELSYYSVCVHDLTQLTIPEFFGFTVFHQFTEIIVIVPAEMPCLLVHNIKKHCTSQCFVLTWYLKDIRSFRKGQLWLGGKLSKCYKTEQILEIANTTRWRWSKAAISGTADTAMAWPKFLIFYSKWII